MDYFCIPYMLQCGHSFCFSCLESWTVSQEDSIISGLIDEMSCPNCRTIISQIPVMNRALRQVLEQSTNCQEEGILPMEDVDSYSVRLSRETEHFKKITLNGSITPWDDIFLKPLMYYCLRKF